MTNWQPIETAPKDDTRILIIYGQLARRIDIARWRQVEYLDARTDEIKNHALWVVHEGDSLAETWAVEENSPTHWMPLPSTNFARNIENETLGRIARILEYVPGINKERDSFQIILAIKAEMEKLNA